MASAFAEPRRSAVAAVSLGRRKSVGATATLRGEKRRGSTIRSRARTDGGGDGGIKGGAIASPYYTVDDAAAIAYEASDSASVAAAAAASVGRDARPRRREIDPRRIDADGDPFVSNKEYGGKWDDRGPVDSIAEVLAMSWDIMALVDADEVAREQEIFEGKDSPVSPFGAWPGGQSWRSLADFSRAPVLYPSAAVVEDDALKVGAYVSRVVQCSRFVLDKRAQRPTVRSLQSFLEAAFWRVMQNSYSVCLRLRPRMLAAMTTRTGRGGGGGKSAPSPSDPNWYAASNQFFWRGMRVPSLLLPGDVPPEENVERGPTAAAFRNAGAALFLWPWARASLEEREKRLMRSALWALDILDATILASFPYLWKPHAGDRRFEENLDCLAEYFGLAALLTETVLAAALDHTLAFMKALGVGNYDDYEEDRFVDPGRNKYLMGVEGVTLTRLNSAGTALAVVCANTYAAVRHLPSVATAAFASDYRTETQKARKPSREDLFVLLQRESLFYTIWLQRVAVHLDLCRNVLKDAAKKGKQEFPLRRSALVRHAWLQKLLAPLVAPVSPRDFAAAKKETVLQAKIETYVKAVPPASLGGGGGGGAGGVGGGGGSQDPKGTIRFISSEHVKDLMASYEKYDPVLDEPMLASRAFDDVYKSGFRADSRRRRSRTRNQKVE